jgi:signal transduction histidine kinase
MRQTSNLDEKVLRRRKAMVTGMVALTIMVLLGFIFGSWKFLQNMEDYLEEELGRRLLATATLTSQIIETADFPSDIELGRLNLISSRLKQILTDIQRQNQLQGVYLVDLDFRLFASSPELFPFGERLSFIEEDSLSVSQASAGIPEAARMQLVAGNRFKNAYSPVFSPFGDVVAIIVVQASADFFDLLRVFQNGLVFGGIISISIAALFSLVLFWAIRLLIKTHESLRNSEHLAAMGQMAATVAHEIRNPLGIIKGTADVLQSKYGSQDEPDELFEFIPSEVRRLNRLVSDFLAFARDRELERNASDLKSSVERSLVSLQDEIRKANVTLEKEYDDLPEVKHDEDAVNQLILNFTLNAIQAMNGAGKIMVRLKNEPRRKGGRYVKVEIEDTGCGFDVKSEKIFEPFYTTKTSGSGLGLAICKRLVEKHNGWIEVDSEKDKGTIVRFYLPVG